MRWGNEWTPKQDALLREHYDTCETSLLEPLIGKTSKQIRRRAHYLGISKSKQFIFEQKRRLGTKHRVCKVENCGRKHAAHGFCHNHDALFLRGTIDQNGDGEYQSSARWTPQEESILQDLFSDATITTLLKALPARTRPSIMTQAAKMGLKKSDEGWKRCHNEKVTPEFRILQSCVQRGLNPEDFNGFATRDGFRLRNSQKYREWRLAVYTRDDFTCQICRKVGNGNLNAHHVIELQTLIAHYRKTHDALDANDEYFYDINNGLTLCKLCHHKLHFPQGDLATWCEASIQPPLL